MLIIIMLCTIEKTYFYISSMAHLQVSYNTCDLSQVQWVEKSSWSRIKFRYHYQKYVYQCSHIRMHVRMYVIALLTNKSSYALYEWLW